MRMLIPGERHYTIGSTHVNLPSNEVFVICKDVCNTIKQTNVKEVDENRFIIKGKSKPSIHSFVGWPFVLAVIKIDNGCNVQIYYKYYSPGFRPMRADLIRPFFDELGKRVKLDEIKTDVQIIHTSFFDNLNNQKIDEIDPQLEAELKEEMNYALEKNGTEIKFVEDGVIKRVMIDPDLVRSENGEELLWSYNLTQGIVRKKIIAQLAISNYRIMRIDMIQNKMLGFIRLQDIDDIVVMNTYRASESIGYSMYSGGGGRYFSFAGPRFSSGTSKTIGDIIFIVNGQKISWSGLPDPTGLKNFLKALKKTMYDEVEKLEKKSTQNEIICPKCGNHNMSKSKFCNNCSQKLEFACSQCGKTNPPDSSFCNHCGFTLQ